MSGELDAFYATIDGIGNVAEVAAQDVATLFDGRMRAGRVEARGEQVAIVPGGRGDAFFGDEWADDMEEEIDRTMAREAGTA